MTLDNPSLKEAQITGFHNALKHETNTAFQQYIASAIKSEPRSGIASLIKETYADLNSSFVNINNERYSLSFKQQEANEELPLLKSSEIYTPRTIMVRDSQKQKESKPTLESVPLEKKSKYLNVPTLKHQKSTSANAQPDEITTVTTKLKKTLTKQTTTTHADTFSYKQRIPISRNAKLTGTIGPLEIFLFAYVVKNYINKLFR